jgi:hypothetical protein
MSRTPAFLLVLLTCFHGIATAGPGDAVDDSACTKIAALIDQSTALSLPARVERAFTLTLIEADNAAHRGDHPTALTLLRTFTVEVRGANRVHRVPSRAADALIARAQEAMRALSPPLIAIGR